MSGGVQQSLFFLGLPDLKKLVCVTLTLQEEDEEPRSKQIKTCRELVLLYSDVLASPALDSFTDIMVVMAVRNFLFICFCFCLCPCALGSSQCVFPGVLQCCVSYSLITRLTPSWNKAGLYLISGTVLCVSALSTREGQLCISIEANTVRLPPTTVRKQKHCSHLFVLSPSLFVCVCVCVFSMKKGQIITISRQLPRDGPFRTYRDLQNHWDRLYGYRLPELAEEEVVYCSVYFRPVGERLFTYPLSCIRLRPVQRCPRVDLQGALGSFLSDVRDRVQSVCGLPARLTSKPCYHTASLSTAASLQVYTHTHTSRFKKTQYRPSSSSSSSSLSSVSFSFSDSSGYQSATSLSSSSSSSSLPLFQTASSLTSSSSSVLPPLPPLSQSLVNPPPKLVPIFKNKHPSRHVNVALLRVQKQREQLGGGGEERKRRVTLPSFGKNRPATAPPLPPPNSSSFPSLPIPPPVFPHFNRRPKPHISTAPPPSAHPKVKHISSLSPASKTQPGFILAPKLKTKSSSKPSVRFSSESKTVSDSSHKLQQEATKRASAAPTEAPQPPTLSDVSDKDSSHSRQVSPWFRLLKISSLQLTIKLQNNNKCLILKLSCLINVQ
uniref:DUF4708 domain-containing protein n=1 Tax=Seriola dumerili TaxID=41447 RepID=A0A3B4UW09_SERDU